MTKFNKLLITLLFTLLMIILTNSTKALAATYTWPIGGSNATETYRDYRYYGSTKSGPASDGKYGREYVVNNNLWPNEQHYYSKCEAHYGMDITGKNGKSYDVISVANGKVIATSADRVINPSVNYPDRNQRRTSAGLKDGGGYGNYVIIQENGTGRCFLYGHLKAGSIKVKKGSNVNVGTSIATMGSSGDSGHMHLHFEIRKSKSSMLTENKYGKHYLVIANDSTNLNPENYIGSAPATTQTKTTTTQTTTTQTTTNNSGKVAGLASPDKLKIVGDLNADGKVNSNDAVICLSLSANILAGYKFDSRVLKCADVNGDGKVTSTDACAILQKYAQSLVTTH